MKPDQHMINSLKGLSQIFSSLSQVVFWVRSPGYTEQWVVSQSYETVWGRPCQELYDHPESFNETIISEERDESLKVLNTRLDNDGIGSMIYPIYGQNNKTTWIRDKSCGLKNKEGNIQAIVGIAEVISDIQVNQLRQDLDKSIEIVHAENWLNTVVEFMRRDYRLDPAPTNIGIAVAEQKPTIQFQGQLLKISPREMEVLQGLMRGESAKVTAYRLGLSQRTVETYLDHLRQKTGARTKMALLGQLMEENALKTTLSAFSEVD